MPLDENDVRKLVAQPFYAVQEIHPSLYGTHEPIVSREEWITAAERVIEDEGAKSFLAALLDALEDPVLGN